MFHLAFDSVFLRFRLPAPAFAPLFRFPPPRVIPNISRG